MGAWIEISVMFACVISTAPSLLSWERGLKFVLFSFFHPPYNVAPLVGAWIEILLPTNIAPTGDVAPLVGAWIEISNSLKITKQLNVAPLVGAWIEISTDISVLPHITSLLSWERGLK